MKVFLLPCCTGEWWGEEGRSLTEEVLVVQMEGMHMEPPRDRTRGDIGASVLMMEGIEMLLTEPDLRLSSSGELATCLLPLLLLAGVGVSNLSNFWAWLRSLLRRSTAVAALNLGARVMDILTPLLLSHN